MSEKNRIPFQGAPTPGAYPKSGDEVLKVVVPDRLVVRPNPSIHIDASTVPFQGITAPGSEGQTVDRAVEAAQTPLVQGAISHLRTGLARIRQWRFPHLEEKAFRELATLPYSNDGYSKERMYALEQYAKRLSEFFDVLIGPTYKGKYEIFMRFALNDLNPSSFTHVIEQDFENTESPMFTVYGDLKFPKAVPLKYPLLLDRGCKLKGANKGDSTIYVSDKDQIIGPKGEEPFVPFYQNMDPELLKLSHRNQNSPKFSVYREYLQFFGLVPKREKFWWEKGI